MNSDQADAVSDRQARFFQENPNKAIPLLNVLNRLVEWEATMGGWEAKVWIDARAVVEEVNSWR